MKVDAKHTEDEKTQPSSIMRHTSIRQIMESANQRQLGILLFEVQWHIEGRLQTPTTPRMFDSPSLGTTFHTHTGK